MDALLLQVPPGDLTGPYPALPYLKSFAEKSGFKVTIRDLGIEALYHLTTEDRIKYYVDKADFQRRMLESKKTIGPQEQAYYGLLFSCLGLGEKPHHVAESLEFFKDAKRFYDYLPYKHSSRMVDAFFRLLSAAHFPTIVTPSEYPTVRMLRTMDNVMAHRNTNVNPYVDFYEKVLFPQIAENPPAVIGISIIFSSHSVQALVLGNMIKERFPNVHVTMGGAFLSQWIMKMQDLQLKSLFTCCDSVICGEGEQPFTDLLGCLTNNQPLDEIKSLIHPDLTKEEFNKTGELSYTDISEQPPPDFSDLDLTKYLIPQPVIPYTISRGCYWGKCVFCQNRYGDHHMRRYQTVPVEKALSEMMVLAEQYQTNHFNFNNDVIDPKYLKKFSQAVLDSGKEIIWNTDLRAEKIFNTEFCQLMASAGLNCVAIGFESGCQKTLNAMDKGNQVETTRQVMKDLYDAGIATQAMGFFGFPGETQDDGEETVRFLEENVDRISYYVMGLLVVLPGSRMHDDPETYGLTGISYDNNPMLTPEPMWHSDKRMSSKSVDYLYNRLNRLENLYAIHENPFVGSLSTNHSFLYFRKGPGILKQLRDEDQKQQMKLQELFDITLNQGKTKKFKDYILSKTAAPYAVVSSAYPIERIEMDPAVPPKYPQLQAGSEKKYLVDALNLPIQVGKIETRILNRINGKRNLKSVLSNVKVSSPNKLIHFLTRLAVQGVISVR